ncbi:hypothetical protein ACFQU2_33920 [Siccirubricoccus deserti]
MLFSSATFIIGFLPIVLLGFLSLQGVTANGWLRLGSQPHHWSFMDGGTQATFLC